MAAVIAAYHQGNYPEAERQFAAAVNEAEEFGPQDPRLADALNSLASMLMVPRLPPCLC